MLIAQANSTLHSIQNTTATMTTQLGAFNSIWGAVVDDCNQVITFLGIAERSTVSCEYIGQQTTLLTSNDRQFPLIFWSTINNVNCYYQSIAIALNNVSLHLAFSGP